ncbi:unnamed protein product [Sphagnum tenellum]
MAPHGLAPRLFARFSAVVRSELQNFGAIPVLARSFSARATGLVAMANVTKRNFEDAYEQLKGHLQKADFVAIDLEMTGVESTMWRRNLEMDACETRYQNLKHSAEKFAVWQCGVCPFKWDETARSQLGLGPRLDVRKQNIAEEHEIPLTRSGDVLFAEKIRVQVGEWRDGLLDNQRKWQWTDG